jgi:branched-subunit amino acid aminotransferase/4-amino-4-deoxychorismate lyase
MSFLYLNGKIVSDDEAKISVHDRSYLYGEGLFESFRSYNGIALFLTEHLKRLEWSATFLNVSFPMELDFAKICDDLLKKNNLKDARFKIVLSQATPPAADAIGENTSSNIVIFCTPLETGPATYKLKVIKNCINDALPLSAMKTTNYLVKIVARFEAKDSGFDDGILLNAKGLVTEASTGNLFWVDDKGILNTVAEAHGLLRGITKQELFKLIKDKKLTLRENQITPAELSNSREVFMTNSIVGIKPVTQIDSRQISGGEPGAVTLMLKDLWEKKLKEMS